MMLDRAISVGVALRGSVAGLLPVGQVFDLNEPWWNRTTNLLIKSFYQSIDFIGFNCLRAAFPGLFRTFPHSFRQQTGNSPLFFRKFAEDISIPPDEPLRIWCSCTAKCIHRFGIRIGT